MKRKRLFFNDLLALALACIVSLLFTHGVTQFVNSGNKKRDLHTAALGLQTNDCSVQKSTPSISAACHNMTSPSNNPYNTENNYRFNTQSHKIARSIVISTTVENKRAQSQLWYFSPIYYYFEPGGPSIPITQRKLII